jgi:hypothetical protein
MKMKSQVAALTAVVAAASSLFAGAARADGPQAAYENGAPLASTLDPNEYVVNADGAQEDPNHRMSDTARAYRNGLINGKAMQKQADTQARLADVPPIPPDMQNGQAARVTPIPMPAAAARPLPPEPRYAQYAPPPPPPRPEPAYVVAEAPEEPPPVYAQPVYQQPVYQQPVYVQQVYAPPPPPVQYVAVYQQPTYVAQPVLTVGVPAYPVYRAAYVGGWGYGARGYGYRGWR